MWEHHTTVSGKLNQKRRPEIPVFAVVVFGHARSGRTGSSAIRISGSCPGRSAGSHTFIRRVYRYRDRRRRTSLQVHTRTCIRFEGLAFAGGSRAFPIHFRCPTRASPSFHRPGLSRFLERLAQKKTERDVN